MTNRKRKITDKQRLDWLEGQSFDRDRGLCWRSKHGRSFIAYDGETEGCGKTVREAIDDAMGVEAHNG